jgi:hypothetical protein
MAYSLERCTVKGLMVFVCWVDNGFNATAAAADIGLSQPCVSISIRKLAFMEGYDLVFLNEGGGKVKGLTEQGWAFYDAAKVVSDFIWEN